MASPTDAPQVPDDRLDAVTAAMVQFHERYYGRAPATARTQMLGDDLLACVLGDMYTEVEKTMIELRRQADVHSTRTAFQHAMEGRLVGAVEQITGRRVANFMSAHHVGPDLELALFLLEPRGSADEGGGRRASRRRAAPWISAAGQKRDRGFPSSTPDV